MLRVEFSKNTLTPFQSDLARILNLMKPVSVKIGTRLDTYAAKVTLEYEGHYDETSMKILSEGASLKNAFCATCEVFAYDLDEKGDPDNCYMFTKPKSYEYNAYPDRINVEIEFDQVHGGPNIDKKCKEIEILRDYMNTMRKFMKDEFDKNSKSGDDKMKQKCFFECNAETHDDLRFRDWINSSELAIFVTDSDHKQYTLELRTPTNFDFNTVSIPCFNSLTAYVYEVSDKHPGPANCHKLSSIKDINYKREGYHTFGITVNFTAELENDDVKKHCDFVEFVDSWFSKSKPNEQHSNTEGDNLSDKNSKKEDDNMKHFSSCVGMCAPCSSNGHCLAGIGDDDYVMADKAELIRRLQNDKLGEISIEEIKKVLKKEYDYDYDKERSKATTRISKPEYYLKIAEAVSLRGTCLRRKFGSIIVKDDRIVSTGYVGAPRGRINCCDRGTCYRMEHNVPSGQRYELCRSCHSEMNAVIQASPEEMKDATLYLVGIENDGSYTNADCCSMCKRVIINAGISTVVARQADGGFKTILVSDWVKNDDSLDIDHEGY